MDARFSNQINLINPDKVKIVWKNLVNYEGKACFQNTIPEVDNQIISQKRSQDILLNKSTKE